MTEKPATPSPALRSRVSTGYARLDEALEGGFLLGSAVVLSAPACDELPFLEQKFLTSAGESSLLLCRTLSSAQTFTANEKNVKALVCSDRPVPRAGNVIPGTTIENLTELNLTIADAINATKPTRLVIEILSDILLRHKALRLQFCYRSLVCHET